jgi:hypothetical protein
MRAVLPRFLPCLAVVVGCTSGSPPDLLGLTDQVAVVGQQFVLELDGVDPDGDSLTYSVRADITLDAASMTQLPSGRGLFRWTPLAADIGARFFDFTVSDGSHATTVSITIDVRATAGGIPVFREPLGAGRVINLASEPCTTVGILVEDEDTLDVTIAEEEPRIEGAIFAQESGRTATWTWCPSPAQAAASDRYTLVLSADDGDNPKTIKNYVIVLAGGASPGLVINEVDYDNAGADTSEYLELLNLSSSPTSLAGLKVVLVNGANNMVYDTIDLSPIGTLGPGRFLVIAGAGVSVPTSAIKLDPLWTQDQIQNGSPDGIAIIDEVGQTVIDALSYEGSITAAIIPGFAQPVSLVEGTPLDPTVADANTGNITLCRPPGAPDTNNAANDWIVCANRTPGTANTP